MLGDEKSPLISANIARRQERLKICRGPEPSRLKPMKMLRCRLAAASRDAPGGDEAGDDICASRSNHRQLFFDASFR